MTPLEKITAIIYLDHDRVDINAVEKAILLYLASHCFKRSDTFVSVETLAHVSGFSTSKIHTALKKFKDAGLLSVAPNPKQPFGSSRIKEFHWDVIKENDLNQEIQEFEELPKPPRAFANEFNAVMLDNKYIFLGPTSIVGCLQNEFPDHPLWQNPAAVNTIKKSIKNWQQRYGIDCATLAILFGRLLDPEWLSGILNAHSSPGGYLVAGLKSELVKYRKETAKTELV